MSNNGYDKEEIKRTYRLDDIARTYGVQLTQRGPKWIASCPFGTHTDKRPSFAIFPGDDGYQLYKCLSCDAAGDVISFVEAMDGVDFQRAIRILTGERSRGRPSVNPRRGRAPLPPAAPAPPVNIYAGMTIMVPPPGNAPFKVRRRTPEICNPTSGKSPSYTPEGVYPYTRSDGRVVGYVLRVMMDGKKFCPAVLWVKHLDGRVAWTHFHIPAPRLYRLHDLFRRPAAPVIITEGEKCADAAARLLPDMVSITWCGGTAQWQKANWKPVTKRKVVLWPDNDAAGRACMLGGWHGSNGSLTWKPGLIETLLANDCTVEIVPEPRGKPESWDIADALAEGFTPPKIALYLKAQLEPWSAKSVAEYQERTRPLPEPEPVAAPVVQLRPVEQTRPDNVLPFPKPKPPPEDWDRRLERDDHGKLKKKSPQNFWVLIASHVTLAGVFAWNSFDRNIYLKKRPPWEPESHAFKPRVLNNMDFPALRSHLEHECEVTPAQNEILPAVLLASNQLAFNPVLDYFDGLKWDGIGRVQGRGVEPWLTEYMGANPSEINTAYGMRWLISCVARAYQPGCKADCMLILEGRQGVGKSSVFNALAEIDGSGRYFTDSLRDFVSKDSKQLLNGKLIVEIPELSAYRNTHDVAAVKMWLSCLIDDYRPPYGHVPETFPRTCVFAGTVNPGGAGYLNDPTGERRFWPVAVTKIDVDRVRRDRDQLWAEAVHLYRADERHYLTEAEEAMSETVTRKRQHRDAYHSVIISFLRGHETTTVPYILEHALELPKRDWTPAIHLRVANVLHSEHWQRTMETTADGGNKEVYTPRIDS